MTKLSHAPCPPPPPPRAQNQLFETLIAKGLSDARVLQAMMRINRAEFIPHNFRDKAALDIALPIAMGQTISQPSIVALMSERLEVEPRHKVLEVGTGSGYQSAVLCALARRVYSLERHQELADKAKALLEALAITNIIILNRDGIYGMEEQAPFDRIIVTASSDNIPPKLLEQLHIGGKMIIPVGANERTQQLIKVVRTENSYEYEELKDVCFVPLREGVSKM